MIFSKYQAYTLSVLAFTICSEAYYSQDIWSNLNQSVNGRLHAATPLALPCFSSYEGKVVEDDSTACNAIQKSYTSSLSRTDFFSGYANFQDEICPSIAGDGCLLNNGDPFDPLAYSHTTCNQGSVSDYYIDVQEPNDVMKAFKVSKERGIKLAIKNSGSSNSGKSSLKGSLALWVRNLRSLSYDPSFIPEGCGETFTAQRSITVGAGINFDELYEYAEDHNVTFVGGYADSLGVSGGWVQGGGQSILSPVYGLAADRVIQYKLVTPDGVLRSANSCQNQDLFWALRGGGGGTFGVVLESTHKVEEQLRLTVASIVFPQTKTNYLPFMEILINNTAQWAQEGWGGHMGPGSLINVTPLLSVSEAKASLNSVTDYALGQKGTAVIESLTWYEFYHKYIKSSPVPVGGANLLSSRLIPLSLFHSASGRTQMLSFLKSFADRGSYASVPLIAPVLYPYDLDSTSATPAWRNSVWLLVIKPQQWTWNSTVAEKQQIVNIMGETTKSLEELTPESGTHLNEADPWTRNWKQAFWGVNYDRLLEIKQKYDPDRLLNCWLCVGFEESDAGHECFSGFLPREGQETS